MPSQRTLPEDDGVLIDRPNIPQSEIKEEDYNPSSSPKASEPARLSANQAFDFAFSKLLKTANKNGRASIEIIESAESSSVYGARFTASRQNVILMSPASDADHFNGRNLGTTPLPEVLKEIRTLQHQSNPEDIFFVPLAECQTMLGGLTSRQHWTMLMIQGNQCYFFDPCSGSWWPTQDSWWPQISASCVYSLDPLKDILKKAGFSLEEDNIKYLGWQTDKVNCGRFSAEIAARAAEVVFAGKHAEEVSKDLENKERKPNTSALVKDFNVCRTDRRIAGNQSICGKRGQGFMENKLGLDTILNTCRDSESLPLYLVQFVKNDGFEVREEKISDPGNENLLSARQEDQERRIEEPSQERRAAIEPDEDLTAENDAVLSNNKVTLEEEKMPTLEQNTKSQIDEDRVAAMRKGLASLLPPPVEVESEEQEQLKEQEDRRIKMKQAEAQKTPRWKIALGAATAFVGFAAILTGVGALIGIPILAGITTWVAAVITGVGGITAISSVAYTASASLGNWRAKKVIDECKAVNKDVDSRPDVDHECVRENPSEMVKHRPATLSLRSPRSNSMFASHKRKGDANKDLRVVPLGPRHHFGS